MEKRVSIVFGPLIGAMWMGEVLLGKFGGTSVFGNLRDFHPTVYALAPQFALAAVCRGTILVLSWTAVPALGRQWRIEAGLSSDHQLVTTGPYAVVRHPIYTSMLRMLFGTGFMITPLRTLLVASLVFIVGMEIRVRSKISFWRHALASSFSPIGGQYLRTFPS